MVGDKDESGVENDGVLFHAETGLLCDVKSANERVRVLDDERVQLGKSKDRITRKVEDGEKGIDLLREFLIRYKFGFDDEMRREAQSLAKQIEACRSEIESINRDLEILDEGALQRTSQKMALEEAKQRLVNKLRSVDNHKAKYEDQRVEWEERLPELSAAITQFERDEKDVTSSLEVISGEIAAIEGRINNLTIMRTKHEGTRDRIRHTGGDPQSTLPSARASIDAAWRHYEEAETDYTRQSNDVALAELNVKLSEVIKMLSKLNQDYSQKFKQIRVNMQEALKEAQPNFSFEELLTYAENEAKAQLQNEADARAFYNQREQEFAKTKKTFSGKRMDAGSDAPKTASEAHGFLSHLEALIETYSGAIDTLQEKLRLCDAKVTELATGLQRLIDQIDSSVISPEWKEQAGTLHRPYESVDDAIDRWKAALKEATQADQKVTDEKKIVDQHIAPVFKQSNQAA